MIDPLLSSFPHRHNSDKTYDSICPFCYKTVATQRVENDLRVYEEKHVCREMRTPGVSKAKPFIVIDRFEKGH